MDKCQWCDEKQTEESKIQHRRKWIRVIYHSSARAEICIVEMNW